MAVDTRAPGVAQRKQWQRKFAVRLFTTDVVVVCTAVLGSHILWFGFESVELTTTGIPDLRASYGLVSVVLIAAWMLILDVFATRDHKVIGSGTLEYKRVVDSTIRLFGVFAIVALLFKLEIARGYLLTALPFGLLMLLFSRWAWRQWLRKQQARGNYLARALLLGERRKATHVAATIQRAPGSGLLLVGALTQS